MFSDDLVFPPIGKGPTFHLSLRTGKIMADIVTLPGIGNSGQAHWQTLWEAEDTKMRRFGPADWDRPDLDDWSAALDRAVDACSGPPILVAHSLACLLVAHWQKVSPRGVAGAFLVAVPDPKGPAFPIEATGFDRAPESGLRFPSLIVASSDDPYGSLDYVRTRATQWGSGFVLAGALGHINARSGLGGWPAGRDLLTAFAAGIGPSFIRKGRP